MLAFDKIHFSKTHVKSEFLKVEFAEKYGLIFDLTNSIFADYVWVLRSVYLFQKEYLLSIKQ